MTSVYEFSYSSVMLNFVIICVADPTKKRILSCDIALTTNSSDLQ